MVQEFTASVWQEEDVYVAQCLQIDVASQGPTEDEALQNLKEALELHLMDPVATSMPALKTVKVQMDAA
jgi:predicted RNase H-like HicB family nuclease